MQGELFFPLGAGRAPLHRVGQKGAMLDKAARIGLRVPKGVVLLDAVIDLGMLAGLIVNTPGGVVVPDAAALLRYIGLPKFTRPVAVRSAFSVEDRADESMAGYFQTVLHVDAQDPRALADALCRVWSSVMRPQPSAILDLQTGEFAAVRPLRRDVLIMEMVEARVAGVAFTEVEYEDDMVNFTGGTADKLVAGEVGGETLLLPKLRGWERWTFEDEATSWKARLQALLRDVRRWLGERDWDIEWADDGQRCWLVQARPITRPVRRDEHFTIANHKEILPPLPSRFMTSVVESCSRDLFGYYRQFDARLPAARPFIEVFAGRPYINLSLLTEMMRSFGLPSRMVTDNIGGAAERHYGVNVRRMVAKTLRLVLPRFALAQLRAASAVRRRTAEMEKRQESLDVSLEGLIDEMRWLYTALVTEMFALTAAIGPMLLLLRAFGTLEAHAARHETVSTGMFAELEPLQALVERDEDLRERLLRGELPEDHAAFMRLWTPYLARYGHRGIYESDIARPRYREDPLPLLVASASPVRVREGQPRRSALALLTFPLWFQAGRAIRAREQWRHDIMRGFGHVRAGLLARAAELVERGALPSTAALWHMDIAEVRRMAQGWTPDPGFFARRQAEIDDLKRYHLPDLLRRFDDLETFRDGALPLPAEAQLKGVSLTRGDVYGRAWVLDEPAARLPEGFEIAETILVARSVDAGWIPTFGLVAGVVVETGGDLSHGSIILREIGLPAVTNVSGATRRIAPGAWLRLRAGVGVVEKPEEAAPTGEIALDTP